MKNNAVIPTLETAVAGDITLELGYRTMTDINRQNLKVNIYYFVNSKSYRLHEYTFKTM